MAGILKYELLAAQHTRAFYVQVFLPWAEKKKLPTDPSLWFCDWWDTPDEVLQSFRDQSAYPWRPYARTHDWATVHRSWHQGRIRRARGCWKRCGPRRATRKKKTTSNTGSTAAASGLANRPPPKPARARRSGARPRVKRPRRTRRPSPTSTISATVAFWSREETVFPPAGRGFCYGTLFSRLCGRPRAPLRSAQCDETASPQLRLVFACNPWGGTAQCDFLDVSPWYDRCFLLQN